MVLAKLSSEQKPLTIVENETGRTFTVSWGWRNNIGKDRKDRFVFSLWEEKGGSVHLIRELSFVDWDSRSLSAIDTRSRVLSLLLPSQTLKRDFSIP